MESRRGNRGRVIFRNYPSATRRGNSNANRALQNLRRSSIANINLVKEKLLTRRSGYYDDAKEALVKENNGIRIWYHNYTTIDWIHDFVKERVRLRHLRSIGGIRGMLKNRADSLKGWVLVLLTGVITACLAAFIDVSSWWLGDLRMGYCTTNFWWSQYFCCWGATDGKLNIRSSFCSSGSCPEWVSWSQALSSDKVILGLSHDTFDWIVYCCFGICVVMVTSDGTVSQQKSHGSTKRRNGPNANGGIPRSSSRTSMETVLNSSQPKKIAYFGAGSGIPEVKTILGGFVIRGFLGFRTLMIKLIGLPLMVASGLNMGKQGPLVHISCCVANIVCRIFDKYNRNDGKRREILSAAAASGVAVAFGAPIGGVLFSLEEVSYYFPSKTMWRTYFCALISAVVLKMINPYRVGKTVLFQVTYDRDWHLFESIPFFFISVFGGVYGAVFSQFHMNYSRFRSRTWIGRHPVQEVLIVTLLTCAIQWLNPWTRVNLLQLLTNLYSECTPDNNLNGMCATDISQIYPIFLLLAEVFVMKVALNFITFGVKVPGGIFIPTMVAGAVFGRMVGLGVQWLIVKYPEHQVFAVCEGDSMDCIIPGLYALIGAAACLSGVTRMTVSLVVIMFELTGAMTYSLPIMMAVMMGKFVGDAFSPDAFFNKLIDLNEHPYLDNKKDYNTFGTAADIADRYLETIDVNAVNDVDSLRRKVEILAASGYSDGGLPIVDRGVLVGYIASNELGHALELAEQKHPDCICIFRNRASSNVPATEIITSLNGLEAQVGMVSSPTQQDAPYSEFAPLSVSLFSSMDLVMELFIKLGIKYVCVVKAGEHYGMIHKKRLLSFLKENDEKQKRNVRRSCF
ncbi:MAG: clc channel [Linnemannia gamsii]|nr:MAG: clc channel [Linnemannia gamsii]